MLSAAQLVSSAPKITEPDTSLRVEEKSTKELAYHIDHSLSYNVIQIEVGQAKRTCTTHTLYVSTATKHTALCLTSLAIFCVCVHV